MTEIVYIVASDYQFRSTLYGVYTDKYEAEQRRLAIALKLVETAPKQELLNEVIEDMGFDNFMMAVVKIYTVQLDKPTDILLYME